MRSLLLSLLLLVACGDSGAETGGAGSGAGGEIGSGGQAAGAGGSGAAAAGGAASGGAAVGGAASGGGGQGGSAQGGAGGGAPVDGYGALSGACGEIDLDDVLSPLPELLDSGLDFSLEPAFDVAALSPGGQAMYAAGNLNQSSLYSEIFAYEVLYRCDGAEFLKGESQIVYSIDGKKTDILVAIDGEKVGVSVVRAESFPEGAPYTVTDALPVLEGKLDDILLSSMNVAPEDKWKKQILAVLAQTPDHAAAIDQAWAMMDAATKADTIVLVIETEGDDHFIYYNN